jgi:hypothetical protein
VIGCILPGLGRGQTFAITTSVIYHVKPEMYVTALGIDGNKIEVFITAQKLIPKGMLSEDMFFQYCGFFR